MNNERQLDSLLKQMADDHRPELPSPSLIWWRAQILKKYEQKQRIERPILIMRLVAIVLCLVVFAAMLSADWQQVQALFGRESWLLMPFAVVVFTTALLLGAFFWPAAKRQ
jgi:hypothetical protein